VYRIRTLKKRAGPNKWAVEPVIIITTNNNNNDNNNLLLNINMEHNKSEIRPLSVQFARTLFEFELSNFEIVRNENIK
jgi:hypothetical protein